MVSKQAFATTMKYTDRKRTVKFYYSHEQSACSDYKALKARIVIGMLHATQVSVIVR